LGEIILEMVRSEIMTVVNFHTAADTAADWNIKEISETMRTIWTAGGEVKLKLEEIIKGTGSRDKIREEIINYLVAEAEDKYKRLALGFADVNSEFKEVEKGILIRSMDETWVEHLETVDYLRRGIGLRGYGQRDPLVEYKKEAYHLFQELNNLISRQVVYSIFKTGDALIMAQSPQIKLFAEAPEKKLEFSGAAKEMTKAAAARNTVDLVHEKPKDESGQKVGRNDPCPCGSGKKYKQCHGK
jgi:preprotein translocase subunit SecA